MLTPNQREQFDKEGYLLIENAMEAIGLGRVQEAFKRLQSDTEEAWKKSVIDGSYSGGGGNGPNAHVIPDPHLHDDVFLDLANNPRTIPLLEEIVGPELQMTGISCHCHPSGTEAHTGWHRDWPPWSHPKFILKAKVFYFLDDQQEDMGCFSLVPGTHKLPNNPPKEKYSGQTLEEMPGIVRMVGPAGSVVIWNVLCWHTALANTSQNDRRFVTYGYMPFWVKNWGSRTPHRNIIDWADTPQKRQIVGIHCVHGRRSWDQKNIPYLPEHEEIAIAKKL